MTEDTTYQLGRYEIIEKKNGEVWWETHAGFAGLRAGKCFIEGQILFIGPHKTEEPGFLKGEFIEHLNKLPKWKKTKHYCSSYTLYNCKTNKIFPEIEKGQELDKQSKSFKDDVFSKEAYERGTKANLIYVTKAVRRIKEKVSGAWGLSKDLLNRFLH